MARPPWLRVAYQHDPADLSTVELAVSRREPAEGDWRPAFRDTVDGQRVVCIRAEVGRSDRVWLRDSAGARRVYQVGQR